MNTKPRCLVTCRIHQEVVEYLEKHCTLDLNPTDKSLSPEELQERIREADAVMMFMPDKVDEKLLSFAPRLKVIGAALKGYDNFDVEAATRHHVWLTYVPDLLTAPTAELTVALMLGLSRNVPAGDRRVRSDFRGWRPVLFGTGVAGSTVGLLGMGRLGQAVAGLLRGWNARLLGFDISEHAAAGARERGVDMRPLEEVLKESDFVLVLTPLTPGTRNLLDAGRLALMKQGAFLVNTGRGSCVDEQAVAQALESGRLAGYAADVFAFEDWALDSRPESICPALLSPELNTLFTPHLGSAVDRVRLAIEMAAAENIVDVLEGRVPRHPVNCLSEA